MLYQMPAGRGACRSRRGATQVQMQEVQEREAPCGVRQRGHRRTLPTWRRRVATTAGVLRLQRPRRAGRNIGALRGLREEPAAALLRCKRTEDYIQGREDKNRICSLALSRVFTAALRGLQDSSRRASEWMVQQTRVLLCKMLPGKKDAVHCL